MKPRQCNRNKEYLKYTQTTQWFWRANSCNFTPMMRALEAFLWLGVLSLLANIALNIRDMQKKRQADIIARSEITGYPALPKSSTEKRPKVEEVIEVV